MVLQDKTTGKKAQIDLEDISLDNLKEHADLLCRPNEPLNERIITAKFPFNRNVKSHNEALDERNKVYLEIKEEVTDQLIRMAQHDLLMGSGSDTVFPEGTNLQDLKLEEIRFKQVYIEGLGNLVIDNI